MTQAPRTITVTTRRRAWRTRLALTHPDQPPAPSPGTPTYDTDCARELLHHTATKHDLKIVLTEYGRGTYAAAALTATRSRTGTT